MNKYYLCGGREVDKQMAHDVAHELSDAVTESTSYNC